MQNWRRSWGVVFVLLLIGLMPWPVLGQRGGGLDILLLVDSSGSTTTTDPEALRVAAAQFLLDYVQAVGEVQGGQHRFAAANFNTTIQDELPWTYLQGDSGRDQLVARSEGGTDFKPALEWALSLRREPGNADKAAVVLFTDGSPCPSEPCPQGDALETYFQGLESPVAALRDTGAQVFVVALGDDSTVQQWKALVGASNYRFVNVNTDLAGVYHDFLTDLLGLRGEAVRPLRDGESTSITVEPYLEQLVLSVIKADPRVQVTVTDPFGGTPLPARGGADALHVVYALPSPAAGNWQVRVRGGAAQVWVDRQYATLVLEVPAAPQALGAPVAVTGQLIRRGVIIDDADLHLQVTATGPDGQAASFDLTRGPAGRYQGSLTNLTAEGVYTLTLSGEWDGQPVGARQTTVVTTSLFAIPAPDILEIQGTMLTGTPITVTVQVSHADKIGPATEVFVRLLRADGSTVETPALHDDGRAPDTVAGDGLYAAALRLPDAEGRYRVECVVQGASRDGVAMDVRTPQQVLDVRSTLPVPTFTPSPLPSATPPVTPTPSGNAFDVPDIGKRYPWLLIELLVGGLLVAGYGIRVAAASKKDSAKSRADLEAEREKSATAEKELEVEREQRTAAEKELTAANEQLENHFVNRAKESYEKGKQYLENQEYEKAQEAFTEYFDILAQGFKAQNMELSPILGAATAGLLESLKNLPEERRDATLLEQVRLRLPDELDKVRFQRIAKALPDLWPHEEAVGKLYALLAQGGRREPLLTAIAGASTRPLSPIARALQPAIEDPTYENLHDVAIGAKQLPADSGKGLHEMYTWLEELSRHTEPIRLPAAKTQPVLTALRESGLQPLEELVETAAQQLLSVPQCESNKRDIDHWTRVSEYLKNGQAAIRSHANEQLPETQILLALSQRWLMHTRLELQKTMPPPEIEVKISPSLSQVLREEVFKDGYWLIGVPVNLFNAGGRPAHDVEIKVHPNTGTVTFMPNSAQRVVQSEKYEDCVQRLPILTAGQAEHLVFRLEVPDGADRRLQIEVRYVDEVPHVDKGEFERVPKSCEPQYLEIAPPPSLKPKPPVRNPYTTGPLLNDEDWQRMGKAQAHKTVQEIIATVQAHHRDGRFIHVLGLRRTGKTTILRRVLSAAQKLTDEEDTPLFMEVYLDLNRWLDEIDPYREKIAGDRALWYMLLREVFQGHGDKLPGELRRDILRVLEPCPHFDPETEPPCLPEVSIDKFRGFLGKIKTATGCTLLLALDEGDVLADLQPELLAYRGHVPDLLPEPTPVSRIMFALQRLVEDRQATILLARGYNEAVWEHDDAVNLSGFDRSRLRLGYNDPVWEHVAKPFITARYDTWPTQLLNREETIELLAEVGGFLVTDLGQETFWRLTGGYPLLIQLLGDYLYKQRSQGLLLPGVISNGAIKRALFDIITTPLGAETLDFMRYGFKREEEMVLQVLAVWFTDSNTGFLQGVEYGKDSYSGLVTVLERLREMWPKTWEEIEHNRLVQITDRLVGKRLLETPDLRRLRWRVGWLYVLMLEVFVENGIPAKSLTGGIQ